MTDPGKIIAIVDDDETLRDAIEQLLTAHGFVAQVFASAEAFLNCRTANQAACLVLDINLPGMSGVELNERLKAGGSELPVIFITAADDNVRRQAANAGCVACLRKPFAAVAHQCDRQGRQRVIDRRTGEHATSVLRNGHRATRLP